MGKCLLHTKGMSEESLEVAMNGVITMRLKGLPFPKMDN